jgi:monothiol glutaredoxin
MIDGQVLDCIGDKIAANDVALFMKGTPQFPQCGFSAAVTNVLL